MAAAHFAVGAECTVLVLQFIDPCRRYRWGLILAGGLWAVVPDLYWPLPVLRPVLVPIHDSVLANLFWFHGFLDTVDPNDTMEFVRRM